MATMTSHPVDRVDAQDFKAFGHDGGGGFTEEHPPHVDFDHLTCRTGRGFSSSELKSTLIISLQEQQCMMGTN